MKTQEYQAKVIALQGRIFKEHYHDALWCKALAANNMSTATVDQHEHEDEKLAALLQDFWEMLPDSPSIRHGPFFELCDLCSD